jgi:hypothetical protein
MAFQPRFQITWAFFIGKNMDNYSLFFFKKVGVYEASVFAQNQEYSVTLLNKYLSSINEAFGYSFASVTRSDIYSASSYTPEGAIIGVHEFILQERSEDFHTLNVMATNSLDIHGFYNDPSAKLLKNGECEVAFSIARQAFDLITSKKARCFLYVTDRLQFQGVQDHLNGIK